MEAAVPCTAEPRSQAEAVDRVEGTLSCTCTRTIFPAPPRLPSGTAGRVELPPPTEATGEHPPSRRLGSPRSLAPLGLGAIREHPEALLEQHETHFTPVVCLSHRKTLAALEDQARQDRRHRRPPVYAEPEAVAVLVLMRPDLRHSEEALAAGCLTAHTARHLALPAERLADPEPTAPRWCVAPESAEAEARRTRAQQEAAVETEAPRAAVEAEAEPVQPEEPEATEALATLRSLFFEHESRYHH